MGIETRTGSGRGWDPSRPRPQRPPSEVSLSALCDEIASQSPTYEHRGPLVEARPLSHNSMHLRAIKSLTKAALNLGLQARLR